MLYNLHLSETTFFINLVELGHLVQLGVSLTAKQGVAGSSPGPATFFRWDMVMKKNSMTILTLRLIQEGQLSVTGDLKCC